MKICTNLSAYQKLSMEEKLATYLTEDIAATITTVENHDPLVNIREYDMEHLLRFDPSMANFQFRRAAADGLLDAAKQLKQSDRKLLVYETFRPYEKQKREFEEISKQISTQYPHLSGKDLWRKITEFIADPDLCPPHASGGAVDLTLLDAQDEPIDMGTPVNDVSPLAYLMNDTLSPPQRAARDLLLKSMMQAGFAPMPTEWWHFSYGEKYWGAFYGKEAIYATLK